MRRRSLRHVHTIVAFPGQGITVAICPTSCIHPKVLKCAGFVFNDGLAAMNALLTCSHPNSPTGILIWSLSAMPFTMSKNSVSNFATSPDNVLVITRSTPFSLAPR